MVAVAVGDVGLVIAVGMAVATGVTTSTGMLGVFELSQAIIKRGIMIKSIEKNPINLNFIWQVSKI